MSRQEPAGALVRHLQPNTGTRVVDALAASAGLTKAEVKSAMRKGAVWLTRCGHTRRIRRASAATADGDEVHLYYNPDVLSETPRPCDLIADEDAYSVWYKPFGVRSQGSKWGDHCTVYRWAEQHLKPERPAFIVHRLDRAATGLILVAHRKGTATQLAKLFEGRDVDKRYCAIVHGAHPMGESARRIDAPIDGREAVSHVRAVEYDEANDRSLVEVRIETGRRHQIRRHLAETGYPVVGDRLYGKEGDSEDLQLVACRLAFPCPVDRATKVFDLPERYLLRLAVKE